MILEHKQFDLYGYQIFEKIRLEPPYTLSSSMPNEACFLYMEEGAYDISAETEIMTIQTQDAVLMRCGSYFTEFLKSAASDSCEAIVVHLYPEVLRKIFERELKEIASTLQQSQRLIRMNRYANHELIKIYIESVKIYFDNPELVNDELLILKLRELIILLTKTEKAPTIGQLITGLFSRQESTLREVVEAHLYEEFSVEKMAVLSNMSPSSFKREFARIFGDSPGRYVKNARLERAAELLTVSRSRISDIAYQCGFSDLAHFSKSFQAKYGLSPSDYRLNHFDK